VPEAVHPRIRTYHARNGRLTAEMRRALVEVAPRFHPDRRDPARPLVLEVGSGHGEAALAFADAHPDVDVLAAEVHAPGAAHLLLALEAEPRPNVHVRRHDAVDLLDHEIGTGTLAGVHVFFPDPWPKARHRKRRFVRPDVVDLVVDRLAPGGTFRFATDVDDHGAAARAVLDAHPDLVGGPGDRPWWRPLAGYEAKAVAAGRHVHELVHRRR